MVLSSDRSKYPNYYSYLQRGVLKRVTGPATVPVIVNDVLQQLPVVRAQAEVYGDKVEFLFLDDPANPLTLVYRIGIDGIKPLIPAEVELCDTMAKNDGGRNPGTVPGFERSLWPAPWRGPGCAEGDQDRL